MGWKEVGDVRYEDAGTMGTFLRGWASFAVIVARLTSIFWGLFGLYSIVEGQFVAIVFCIVLAVFSWVSANPLAIILKGLADLGDALVDTASGVTALNRASMTPIQQSTPAVGAGEAVERANPPAAKPTTKKSIMDRCPPPSMSDSE